MKIKYNKKHFNIKLFSAIAWGVFGMLNLYVSETLRWNDYGYFCFGLIYLSIYIYEKQTQYICITNGILKINDPIFGKKINLSKLISIKKFAGDYILKTKDKTLEINTQIIEPKSLEQLTKELESLGLKWE